MLIPCTAGDHATGRPARHEVVFRQHLLSHGLLVAESPLPPLEREVMQGLLGGQTEKQVAAALSKRPHTTHDHVKKTWRKFEKGAIRIRLD